MIVKDMIELFQKRLFLFRGVYRIGEVFWEKKVSLLLFWSSTRNSVKLKREGSWFTKGRRENFFA